MDKQVFLIVGSEEYYLGRVGAILADKKAHTISQAVKEIVDNLVFDDGSSDYVVCSIEAR